MNSIVDSPSLRPALFIRTVVSLNPTIVRNDVHAYVNAFVADEHFGARDEFANISLRLLAERAAQNLRWRVAPRRVSRRAPALSPIKHSQWRRMRVHSLGSDRLIR
jgi:hypothetical protein